MSRGRFAPASTIRRSRPYALAALHQTNEALDERPLRARPEPGDDGADRRALQSCVGHIRMRRPAHESRDHGDSATTAWCVTFGVKPAAAGSRGEAQMFGDCKEATQMPEFQGSDPDAISLKANQSGI